MNERMDVEAGQRPGEVETGIDTDKEEKMPFAFSKSTCIEKKGASMFLATCGICGKTVKATPHKMLYGHYLQKKGQHMGVHCVARTILERDHPTFLKKAEERWEALERKRAFKVAEENSEKKKQRGLGKRDELAMEQDFEGNAPANRSNISTDSKETPWDFLSPAHKQKRREECQDAWDLAFAVCGIKYATADDETFRAAITKTRGCPDFKVSCAKTMRTTRLDKQNDAANQYKALRMKAGLRYGFVITSDGWRSVAKRQYHNYLLISVEGPIFLELKEVTGHGGTGEDVKDGFEAVFNRLGDDITKQVVLGVTDTPTANRKAWRLLEAAHPKQLWVGCAAHEVSLLFKEWVKKTPSILYLFHQGLKVVKWVNNHSEILKLFREIVPSHFDDKRKHCLTLYMPGDTRFMTVFKMLQRISVLWDVLSELVNRSDYDKASQKALKQWSDLQPEEKKLTMINGRYPDSVQHMLKQSSFKQEIECFIEATKSTVFLLRLVDGQSPVLGKFYYSCAMVDKHLRVLQEGGNVPYIAQMRAIFAKRWKRWHRPVHTLAYALDPCYQQHELSRTEKKECMEVIRKLCPGTWAAAKIEFDRWRTAGESIFAPEVWQAADLHHGYLWWESFGDDFEHIQPLARKLLSKAVSASACEFNWSDVGQVVTKKTQRFGDATIEKIVNIRAMHKLGKAVKGKIIPGNVPKLDDILDEFVNEVMERVGTNGDDVAEAEDADDDESDDEQYELLDEEVNEEDAHGTGMEVNENLLDCFNFE